MVARVRNPLSKAYIQQQKWLFAVLTCPLVAFFWQTYLHPRIIIATKQGNHYICLNYI